MFENQELKQIDGHRLTEFIYGTVTALVAVAGIDPAHISTWYAAALVVIAGGIAIWFAHTYSTLMSERITRGHRIKTHHIVKSLKDTWPVVSAALLVSLPFLGNALSLYSINMALWLANVVGILILAIVGYGAGVVTNERWTRKLLLMIFSSGLGLFIVAVELMIHH